MKAVSVVIVFLIICLFCQYLEAAVGATRSNKADYVEIFGPGSSCQMKKYPGIAIFKHEELPKFNPKKVQFRVTQYSPRIVFYAKDDTNLDTFHIEEETTSEEIKQALIDRGFKPRE